MKAAKQEIRERHQRDAEAILSEEIRKLKSRSYEEFAALLASPAVSYIQASSGTTYRIRTEVYREYVGRNKTLSITVFVDLDTRNWSWWRRLLRAPLAMEECFMSPDSPLVTDEDLSRGAKLP